MHTTNVADEACRVEVDKDLAELIPNYLSNRKKEPAALRNALAQADFGQLRLIGHRMKGVGQSYGFARISAYGSQIEDAAKAELAKSMGPLIDEYERYLSRVSVTFV